MGLNQIVLLAANSEGNSLSDGMTTAGLYTIMGITIVLLVLNLIVIISLFKYIKKFDTNAKKKNEQAVASLPSVGSLNESVETKELANDLELVAVITAAIHAYEEAKGNHIPANGLYVRSIRKVNR